MGTKNNPGKFDCHAAAEPDEPMFTLLARDPLAAYLVRAWAKLRIGDLEGAQRVFDTAKLQEAGRYIGAPDREKATEALTCSDAMMVWRSEHRPSVTTEALRHGASEGQPIRKGCNTPACPVCNPD